MNIIPNISALKKILIQVKDGILPLVTLFLLISLLAPAMAHVAIFAAVAFAGGFALHLFRAPKSAEALFEADKEMHPVSVDREGAPQRPGLAIKIGYGLFPLVEDRKGAPLMSRVAEIRHQVCQQLGFVVPHVPIKVDLSLEPNSYRIVMGGMVLGEGVAWPDDILAIDDGDVDIVIAGRSCKDPTFGMNACWVPAGQRALAVAKGYIVVDAPTVIATHLNDVAQRNAAKLFGTDDAQQLLDFLKQSSPQLVDSLTPEPLSLDDITAICRDLLAERVPVKDFGRISLAMAQICSSQDETADIAEAIRPHIGDLIVQSLVPAGLPLPVMTLDASLENLLVKALQADEGASYLIDPLLAQKMIGAVHIAMRSLPSQIRNVALISSPIVRKPLSALLKQRFPDLFILSYAELPEGKSIELLASIGAPSSSQTMAATDANQI
ncbi:MAG: FHIPEP family type III secretion protein [Parasphingorhabdus sp.]